MTPRAQQLGSFRLDTVNQCLWCGTDQISLSPKAFAVLRYMAERPGQLVTKQELLDAVWSDIHVTEGVLKRAVLEIRKALSDPIEEPRYIQTLHRRGYRLVVAPGETETAAMPDHAEVIGRTEELGQLDGWFGDAAASSRQIVFISGEAGLGKTTLVDSWMSGLRERRSGAVTARGRCMQQFGSGEPYLPVFEALDQLGQEMGRRLVDVLRSRAPTWLLHMPALVSLEDRIKLRDEVFGSTRERMLREITDALEVLSEAAPIVIAVEDLHWSDPSTIDLLSAIGRRTAAARLMILATYRPAETGGGASPLFAAQNELELHRQCKVLRLRYFAETDTSRYLARRFPDANAAERLAPALQRRTNGNPLYVVCLADELERSNRIDGDPSAIAGLLPETLQQMFERQAAQLAAREQEMLDAAAVAGETFAIAEVAASLGWDTGEMESLCEAMARRHVMLKPSEPVQFPDGAESPGYAFLHALCRDAIYRKIPAGRRSRLHGRLGRAQSELHASDPSRVAGQLAGHLELAGEFAEAIVHYRQAAKAAAARYSNAEAVSYLGRAFVVVERLREAERGRARMDLLEQRALIRLSASDMPGAAADFGALAAEALQEGDVDCRVRALVESVIPLVFIDYERVVPTLDEAQAALAQAKAPLLAALIDMYRGFISIHFDGWTLQSAQLLGTALSRLVHVEDLRLGGRIAWIRTAAHAFTGEYAAACEQGIEAQHLARKAGIFFDFLLASMYLNWAQIHAGDLGAAIRSAKGIMEIAARNESAFALLWANVRLAWVQMEAYEYGPALASLSARAADPRVMAVRNNGGSIRLWLGMARFGNRDYDGAWEAYAALEADIVKGGLPFLVVCPLLNAKAECAIARQDLASARVSSGQLLETAKRHHELTYVARAHRLLAEIALFETGPDAAAGHIETALKTLTRCETTLAEWRIHATAARIFGMQGKREESAGSRERARAAAQRVAATLSGETELQQTFLARVAAELATAAASA